MTSRATGRSVRVSDVVPLAAVALCAGPMLVAPLQHAGLAFVVVVALIAGALALPTARLAWTAPAARRPFTFATLRIWGLLTLGALLAPRVVDAGLSGVVGVTLGAVLLPVVAAVRPTLRIPLTVFALLGVFWATSGGDGAGLVLLEPGWSRPQLWVPLAATWAALISGVGLGMWASVAPSAPGRRRLYALPAAIAGVGVLAQVITVARWWGAGTEEPVVPWQLEVLVVVAAVFTTLTPTRPLSTEEQRPLLAGWRTTGGLAAATLWFAGPASSATDAWWSSVFLLGPALLCASVAWASEGIERRAPALLALGWMLFALLGWPGVPEQALGAAALALLPVVVVWTAGTRAVLRTT